MKRDWLLALTELHDPIWTLLNDFLVTSSIDRHLAEQQGRTNKAAAAKQGRPTALETWSELTNGFQTEAHLPVPGMCWLLAKQLTERTIMSLISSSPIQSNPSTGNCKPTTVPVGWEKAKPRAWHHDKLVSVCSSSTVWQKPSEPSLSDEQISWWS